MLNHLDKHQVLTSLNHGFRSGFSCETQLVRHHSRPVELLWLEQTSGHSGFQQGFRHHASSETPLQDWSLRDQRTNTSVDFQLPNPAKDVRGSWRRRIPPRRGRFSRPTWHGARTLAFSLPFQRSTGMCQLPDPSFRWWLSALKTISSMKDHQILQQDLNNLQKWATDWGMKFNAKKCYLLSSKTTTSYFYTVNNQILKQV